jgi:hypothetical protein
MEFYPKLTTDSSESRNMLIKLAISIWLISLVFAIKTALIALQLQEWVRIYIDTLNVPSRPRCHRALIRLFSFLGVDLYNAPNMVQLISALHVSMCTFSGGLAIVVHTHKINTIVAIAFDVTVAFFCWQAFPECSMLFRGCSPSPIRYVIARLRGRAGCALIKDSRISLRLL